MNNYYCQQDYLFMQHIKTLALVLLVLVGLTGLFLDVIHPQIQLAMRWTGFIGFPLVYGYISWPNGDFKARLKWFGTLLVMMLFGLVIAING